MMHATLREDGETLHHITSTTGITGIMATAGLIAEAINRRNGYKSGNGFSFGLSVVSTGPDGTAVVEEYTIRECGSFWLFPTACKHCGEADVSKGRHGRQRGGCFPY